MTTTTADLQRQALLEIRDDNRWSLDRLVSEIGTDAETLKRWLRCDLPETNEQLARRIDLLFQVKAFLAEYQPPVPVPRMRSQLIKQRRGKVNGTEPSDVSSINPAPNHRPDLTRSDS